MAQCKEKSGSRRHMVHCSHSQHKATQQPKGNEKIFILLKWFTSPPVKYSMSGQQPDLLASADSYSFKLILKTKQLKTKFWRVLSCKPMTVWPKPHATLTKKKRICYHYSLAFTFLSENNTLLLRLKFQISFWKGFQAKFTFFNIQMHAM